MTDHNTITEADILENTRNFKLKHPKVGLWILTPCFASLCYVKFVTSLIKTMDLFRQIDIPISVEFCGTGPVTCCKSSARPSGAKQIKANAAR